VSWAAYAADPGRESASLGAYRMGRREVFGHKRDRSRFVGTRVKGSFPDLSVPGRNALERRSLLLLPLYTVRQNGKAPNVGSSSQILKRLRV